MFVLLAISSTEELRGEEGEGGGLQGYPIGYTILVTKHLGNFEGKDTKF